MSSPNETSPLSDAASAPSIAATESSASAQPASGASAEASPPARTPPSEKSFADRFAAVTPWVVVAVLVVRPSMPPPVPWLT